MWHANEASSHHTSFGRTSGITNIRMPPLQICGHCRARPKSNAVLESWLGKSGQRDKWSFCLIAAMMTANRRDNEQTTAPEPHTGIQVEGGSGRHQGR